MEDKKPIGYQIKQLSKMFKDHVVEKVNKKGIGSTYFIVLKYLVCHAPVTQKEICEYVGLKAPTISITLASMQQDELIDRKKDTIDSRKVYVSLTEKGYAMCKLVKEVFVESDNLLENVLTKEELTTFYLCLAKMKKALEESK